MPVASVNGVDLYYEISGQGFPLVLAHGYCTSINLWGHQIPLLSQRYQVIAYDARGHGLSSAPRYRTSSVPAMIATGIRSDCAASVSHASRQGRASPTPR